MKKYHVFDGQTPDLRTTINDKRVAPAHIEDSMLNSEAKGVELAKQFMKERFVRDSGSKPKTPFSATISKSKCPSFVNLFDTVAPVKTNEKRIAN